VEQTKKCPKCGVEKPFSDYYKAKHKKYGVQSWCKKCNMARLVKQRLLSYAEQQTKKDTRIKELKTCNQCGRPKYISEFNTQRGMKDGKQGYCKSCAGDMVRVYRSENRTKTRVASAKRAHTQALATPKWVRFADIESVYVLAQDTQDLSGITVAVDHICPLKADVYDPDTGCEHPASGLHVPWNLSVKSNTGNCGKGGKVMLAEILA